MCDITNTLADIALVCQMHPMFGVTLTFALPCYVAHCLCSLYFTRNSTSQRQHGHCLIVSITIVLAPLGQMDLRNLLIS